MLIIMRGVLDFTDGNEDEFAQNLFDALSAAMHENQDNKVSEMKTSGSSCDC